MALQTEPSANYALRDLLREMMRRSRVWSQNTRIIAGHPSLQPDILITSSGRSPVVIAHAASGGISEAFARKLVNSGKTLLTPDYTANSKLVALRAASAWITEG